MNTSIIPDILLRATQCWNASEFVCTEREMMKIVTLPRTPLPRLIFLTVIYVGVLLTGIITNVGLFFGERTRGIIKRYLKMSLILSSLLLLIFGLPNDVYSYWVQYPYVFGIVFCKLRAFISEGSSYASVLTIVAMSYERYRAVCYPLQVYKSHGRHRATVYIFMIWSIAFLAAIPFAYLTTLVFLKYPPGSTKISPESTICTTVDLKDLYLCEASSIIFFWMPCIIIWILHVQMVLKVKADDIILRQNGGSVHGGKDMKVDMLRVLPSVIIFLFVCWLPFHFQRVFFVWGVGLEQYEVINQALYLFTGVFYYISATVNTIIYCVMSGRFRGAFFNNLRWRRRRCVQRLRYREPQSDRDTQKRYAEELLRIHISENKEKGIIEEVPPTATLDNAEHIMCQSFGEDTGPVGKAATVTVTVEIHRPAGLLETHL